MTEEQDNATGGTKGRALEQSVTSKINSPADAIDHTGADASRSPLRSNYALRHSDPGIEASDMLPEPVLLFNHMDAVETTADLNDVAVVHSPQPPTVHPGAIYVPEPVQSLNSIEQDIARKLRQTGRPTGESRKGPARSLMQFEMDVQSKTRQRRVVNPSWMSVQESSNSSYETEESMSRDRIRYTTPNDTLSEFEQHVHQKFRLRKATRPGAVFVSQSEQLLQHENIRRRLETIPGQSQSRLYESLIRLETEIQGFCRPSPHSHATRGNAHLTQVGSKDVGRKVPFYEFQYLHPERLNQNVEELSQSRGLAALMTLERDCMATHRVRIRHYTHPDNRTKATPSEPPMALQDFENDILSRCRRIVEPQETLASERHAQRTPLETSHFRHSDMDPVHAVVEVDQNEIREALVEATSAKTAHQPSLDETDELYRQRSIATQALQQNGNRGWANHSSIGTTQPEVAAGDSFVINDEFSIALTTNEDRDVLLDSSRRQLSVAQEAVVVGGENENGRRDMKSLKQLLFCTFLALLIVIGVLIALFVAVLGASL